LADDLRESSKAFVSQSFSENHLRCHLELVGQKSFELTIVSTLSIGEKRYNYSIILEILAYLAFPLLNMILLNDYVDWLIDNYPQNTLHISKPRKKFIRILIILVLIL